MATKMEGRGALCRGLRAVGLLNGQRALSMARQRVESRGALGGVELATLGELGSNRK
jgi:hypothetical protein